MRWIYNHNSFQQWKWHHVRPKFAAVQLTIQNCNSHREQNSYYSSNATHVSSTLGLQYRADFGRNAMQVFNPTGNGFRWHPAKLSPEIGRNVQKWLVECLHSKVYHPKWTCTLLFRKKNVIFSPSSSPPVIIKGEDGGKLKVSRREGADNRKERMGKFKVGYRYEREEMMHLRQVALIMAVAIACCMPSPLWQFLTHPTCCRSHFQPACCCSLVFVCCC